MAMGNEASRNTPLSRRRLFANVSLGVAAVALDAPVAHRVGSAAPQNAAGDLRLAEYFFPPQFRDEFNPWNFRSFLYRPSTFRDLMYTPMAMYHWASHAWEPLIAAGWEFLRGDDGGDGAPDADGRIPSIFATGTDPEADTLRVRLRDGVSWSDGSPLTAQDVVDTFDLLRLIWDDAWNMLDEVAAEDDLTVRFAMKAPSSLIERAVLRKAPMPSSQFGTYAEQTRALVAEGHSDSSKEWLDLNDQLTTYLDLRMTSPIAAGPYILAAETPSGDSFDLVRNPLSFWADRAGFRSVHVANTGGSGGDPGDVSTDIDYAQERLGPADQQRAVDEGFRILRSPTYAGAALAFHIEALPWFADPRVRQAIALVLDRSAIGAAAYGASGVPVTHMAGMSDSLLSMWFSAADLDELDPYTLDPDRASALLTEAGWVRDGMRWRDPDGTEAAYEIAFNAKVGPEQAAARAIARQLSAFGIGVVERGMTATDLWSAVRDGTVQLAIGRWGSTWDVHPSDAFATLFMPRSATMEDVNAGPITEYGFPLIQQSDVAGEVNLQRLTNETARGLDIQRQKDLVRSLARLFNEFLNVIPLYEFHTTTACLEGVRVSAWPADDDPILRNSTYADSIPSLLMYEGRLRPVQG